MFSGWLDKPWYINSVQQDLAIKRNELSSPTKTWINLDEYCWVKEASPKKLQTVWFHYITFWKRRHYRDKLVTGTLIGGRRESWTDEAQEISQGSRTTHVTPKRWIHDTAMVNTPPPELNSTKSEPQSRHNKKNHLGDWEVMGQNAECDQRTYLSYKNLKPLHWSKMLSQSGNQWNLSERRQRTARKHCTLIDQVVSHRTMG